MSTWRHFKRWMHDRYGIFWHNQNLNDRRDGTTGPMWQHGRAWLHMHPEYGDDNKGKPYTKRRWYSGNVCFCWTIPCHHPGASVDIGGQGCEDHVSLHFGLPFLFDVYLTFEGMGTQLLADRLIPKDDEGRETGIRFFDGGVWWDIWHTDMSWSNTTPRWRHGNWHPLDTLFGRTNYTSRDLRTERVEIPMPEGVYPATVRFFASTWQRPRWPWAPLTRRLVRAEITPDRPIAEPGKGENSYDQDDDAMYSLTTNASRTEEAIAAVVESVLRTRRRYGGSVEWQPAEHEATP